MSIRCDGLSHGFTEGYPRQGKHWDAFGAYIGFGPNPKKSGAQRAGGFVTARLLKAEDAFVSFALAGPGGAGQDRGVCAQLCSARDDAASRSQTGSAPVWDQSG